MKLSQLASACLAVTTAWANSEYPLAFFAKLNGNWVPLAAAYYKEDAADFCIPFQGNLPPIAVEFHLTDQNYTTEVNTAPAYAGLYQGLLGFSTKPSETELLLDGAMKVLSGVFYACGLFEGEVCGIYHGYTTVPFDNCFEVEVYILPYDKETGYPVKAAVVDNFERKRLPEREGKSVDQLTKSPVDSSIRESSKRSLVFFAKIKEYLVPLSGEIFEDFSTELSVLTYINTMSAPVEFNLQNRYARTVGTSTPVYAGFSGGLFVFGPKVKLEPLVLTRKKKVLNHSFYSCIGPDEVVRGISFSTRPMPDCFEVDIYLLPYDREAKTAIMNVS